MSLEDQIRRMGDARAAGVTTPSWRDRSGSGRGRWLLAAAAAAVLIVGAVVVLTNGNDRADVNTADDDPTELDSSLMRRWIPANGEIETITYGDSGFFRNSFGRHHDVALITTPDDAAESTDDDWTTVEVKIPGIIGDDRELGPTETGDSRLTLLDDTTALEITVLSTRFGAADLKSHRDELVAAGTNIAALAATVAQWADDIELVYVGPASVHDVRITGPGETPWIMWPDTESRAQFFATFPQFAVVERDVAELFALEGPEDLIFDETLFMWPSSPGPTEVDETQWQSLVAEIVNRAPETLIGAAQSALDVPSAFTDVSGHAEVTVEGGSGVDLVFDEQFSMRDGGVVIALFRGPSQTIRLAFGPLDPGVAYDRLPLAARLTATEAQLFTARINDAWAQTVPTEPSAVTPPTQTGICAANPVPSDDVLEIATHIAFDRTPLDLDLDGIDDEMLVYDDADGNWFLLIHLQTGWTNAVDMGQPARAVLMNTPDGVPAAADLDGDGGLEFFVGDYGNTARTSAMVSLGGCTLRVLGPENELSESSKGWILHGVGGNSCAPTGCFPRVRCVDDELVLDIVQPTDEWRGNGEADPADVVVVWKTESFTLVDGDLIAAESSATEYPLPDLPAAAPGTDDSDVIDCSP